LNPRYINGNKFDLKDESPIDSVLSLFTSNWGETLIFSWVN